MAELGPKITSSGGAFDLAALTDGDLAKSVLLPAAPVDGTAWIQIEFPSPQSVSGLTLMALKSDRRTRYGEPELEAGDDGRSYRSVLKLPAEARTVAFAPVTAKYFRVGLRTLPPRPETPPAPAGQPAEPAGTQVAELVLHPVAPVNWFQQKAAFDATAGLYERATPAVPAGDAVGKADVIDLTSKMRPDGRLDWTPPAGRWIVLRFGYSLTGARNSPASPEATGLEVDKLDKTHVKAYFDNYLDQYKNATGGLMGKRGLQYVITDSWEAGTANWTDKMFAEFARAAATTCTPGCRSWPAGSSRAPRRATASSGTSARPSAT